MFQEISIQLWKSYPSFNEKSAFSTWMYRVSLNVAFQYLRNEKKRPEKFSTDDHRLKELPDYSPTDVFEEEQKQLKSAINHLNEVERAIVMLYLDEKSMEEIGEIVGISQNYVRVKMNRIKEKLRKIVTPRGNGNQ